LKLYVDTSVWVAVFASERDTPRTTRWLQENAGHEIAISPWVRTEFASALSIKLRARLIDDAEATGASTSFSNAVAQSVSELPVLAEDFLTAAAWCSHPESGLRAGDALHLAVAGRHGATLSTLDRKLAAAGKMFAVKTLLV
jgi:predicted nucleic acid-binding protein